ncbi:MAG: hypothetical protein DI605_13590 [Sphingomonas sp.]|nr:MAG: hypothetical protein DI605_13590 [Sphingomonas sp.]
MFGRTAVSLGAVVAVLMASGADAQAVGAASQAPGEGSTNPAAGAPAAQNAPMPPSGPAGPPANDVEDIVVSGFRQSLELASTIKRDSPVVSDVISAEDIGKFPDQNLADSLQRITGVQITRTAGEGTRASVRGLSPDFTQTLYNGRVLTSPSGGRSFEFTNLASDFVSSVEVLKSPSADQVSGGLAATVDVHTARPLDVGKNRLAITAEALYEQKSEKAKPHVAAYVNHVFSDEFAINVGLNLQERRYRSDTFRGFGFENGVEASRSPRLDYNRDGDFGDAFRFNHEAGTRVILGDIRRFTAVGGFQARPTPGLEFYGDMFYANNRTRLDQPINTLRFTSIVCPTAQQGVAPNGCIRGSGFDDEGRLNFLDADGVDYRNVNNLTTTRNRITSAAGGFKATVGRVKLNGEASFSHARQLVDNFSLTALGRASAFYDFSEDPGNFPQIGFSRGYNPLDPANFRGLGLAGDYQRPTVDHNWDAKLDAVWDAGDGFVRSVRVGGRYSNRRQTFGTSQIAVNATQLAGLLGLPLTPGPDGLSFDASPFMTLYSFDKFLNNYNGPVTYPSTFLSSDVSKVFERVSLDQILNDVPPRRNLANEYSVREKETAAYIRADFATSDDRLAGNIGVRYVHTDQTSSGYAPDLTQIVFSLGGAVTVIPQVTPTSIKRSYDNWLPSANARFKITEQLLVRAAAARVMSRPTLSTLSPSTTVNANTRFITINNPNVDPYLADQFDLSLEYYFGHGGLLSAAVFYKDVKNFIVSTMRTDTLNVTVRETGRTAPLDFSINQPNNGSGSKLKGVEVGAQVPLTFLPGLLDGFGIVANFTYLDAGAAATVEGGPPLPLPGVSKYSYNLVGYYEKGPFSARLAYNYRSRFVNSATSNFGDGSYGQSYGQLDFSTSFDITPQVGITIEGLNLTDSAVRTTNAYGYGRGYENVGRRFTAGVRAKF